MVHQTFERKPPVVYEAIGRHEFTFILLHGRGDIPSDFSQRLLASRCSIGEFGNLSQYVKMIFLHAGICTYRPTIDNQWFDLDDSIDHTRRETQEKGLREHAVFIREIVDHEIQISIPSENIVLFGFSQGCAQILFTLLTVLSKRRLGAIIGMSGWLPFCSGVEKRLSNMTEATSALKIATAYLCEQVSLPSIDVSSESQATPTFIGHGTADEVVDIYHSEGICDILKSLAMPVELHPYKDLGHWWTEPYQLDDILSFLESRTVLRLARR